MQIDVSVNAPMSGKIVELLVEEDSTVTVGQDLLRIEPGEGASTSGDEAPKAKPEGGARSEPKNPEEGNKEEAAPKEAKEPVEKARKEMDEKAPGASKTAAEPAQKSAPAPKKQEKKPAKEESAPAAPKTSGSRNETRVSQAYRMGVEEFLLTYIRSRCQECVRLSPNDSRLPKTPLLSSPLSKKSTCPP